MLNFQIESRTIELDIAEMSFLHIFGRKHLAETCILGLLISLEGRRIGQ